MAIPCLIGLWYCNENGLHTVVQGPEKLHWPAETARRTTLCLGDRGTCLSKRADITKFWGNIGVQYYTLVLEMI